jgi:hypothetical protein
MDLLLGRRLGNTNSSTLYYKRTTLVATFYQTTNFRLSRRPIRISLLVISKEGL